MQTQKVELNSYGAKLWNKGKEKFIWKLKMN